MSHDGSLGLAHAFIDAIADAGADAVKFQTHIAAAESTPAEPFRVKFKLAPTGSLGLTLDQVLKNRVGIGGAVPPFGLDEIEQGKIRVVARANDVTAVRDKTRDEHDAAKPISLIESQMLKEYHRPSVLAGLGLRTNNVLLHKPQAPGEAGSSNGTGCLDDAPAWLSCILS